MEARLSCVPLLPKAVDNLFAKVSYWTLENFIPAPSPDSLAILLLLPMNFSANVLLSCEILSSSSGLFPKYFWRSATYCNCLAFTSLMWIVSLFFSVKFKSPFAFSSIAVERDWPKIPAPLLEFSNWSFRV